ncbi:hypothetical protein EGW08_019143, partial [Elysia chlorotica]
AASGDICPPSPQCLGSGRAACIGTRCKCQAPENLGLGFFLCHRSNEKFCAIFNDPEIMGYDGSTSFAPMSCKFKATHLSIPLCDTTDPENVIVNAAAGSCDIKVTAWGRRRAGKTFIRGVEVRFMIMYHGVIYHHLSRLMSDATNGVYTFRESTNLTPFGLPTTGPAATTVIPGLGRIYSTYDSVDNFGRITAEMCGVEVGIRGVDSILSPTARTAGVYIKVNEDCNPTYMTPDACLCSPPEGRGASLVDLQNMLTQLVGRPVSVDVAIFFKLIRGTTAQIFPGAAPALQELMDTALDCSKDRLVQGLELCIFIMHDIKFLKCYDKTENLQAAASLLSMCLLSVCENNQFTCKDVKAIIRRTRCHHHIDNRRFTIMTHPCNK